MIDGLELASMHLYLRSKETAKKKSKHYNNKRNIFDENYLSVKSLSTNNERERENCRTCYNAFKMK